MSYIITNLTMRAIRSPKGFGINPHLAEKRGTLLLQATFGHTVGVKSSRLFDANEVKNHCHGHEDNNKPKYAPLIGKIGIKGKVKK